MRRAPRFPGSSSLERAFPRSYSLAVTVVLAACGAETGSGPADPATPGAVQVTVTTTGIDLDTDGYALSLTGREALDVSVDGTVTFPHVPAGTYALEVTNLGANCGVAGQNPRSVVVSDGATASASVEVTCSRVDLIALTSARGGGQSIWVMAPDGSSPIRVTTGGLDIDFVWAPDGARFAYVSQRGASDELWTAAWDGSGATRIFRGSPVRSPDWSPDGTRLVLLASIDDGPQDVWVIGADGAGATNITNDEEAGNYADARWSPDGTRVLLESSRSGSQQRDVWTLDPSGAGLRNLTAAAGDDRTARWSSNGDRIAYIRELADHELWVMEADGSNPRRVATPVDDLAPPAWSPDGTNIAFIRGDDVWLVEADGSDPTNLTLGALATLHGGPVWSPDGSRIAFVAARAGDSGADVWAMDADGSRLEQLTDVAGWNGDPRWRP